jgi:hypothetical protein
MSLLVNRWYDAAVGRWVSEDPISNQYLSPILSVYSGNSPTLSRDPNGLFHLATTFWDDRQKGHGEVIQSVRFFKDPTQRGLSPGGVIVQHVRATFNLTKNEILLNVGYDLWETFAIGFGQGSGNLEGREDTFHTLNWGDNSHGWVEYIGESVFIPSHPLTQYMVDEARSWPINGAGNALINTNTAPSTLERPDWWENGPPGDVASHRVVVGWSTGHWENGNFVAPFGSAACDPQWFAGSTPVDAVAYHLGLFLL